MSRDEWAQGAPYWKAPGVQPSDVERSTHGQGSWDAEMRCREMESASGEIHDMEDSIQLMIALTQGKAEKSARYVAATARWHKEQADQLKRMEKRAFNAFQRARDDLHAARTDLARLRSRIDRAMQSLKYGRDRGEALSILGGDDDQQPG